MSSWHELAKAGKSSNLLVMIWGRQDPDGISLHLLPLLKCTAGLFEVTSLYIILVLVFVINYL